MSIEGNPAPAPIVEPPITPPEDVNLPPDANSAYYKLLTEKKNISTHSKNLEEKIRKMEEDKMIEQNNWKELHERSQQENAKLKADMQARDKMIEDSSKLSAIKKELSKIGMDEKYVEEGIKLVDLNGVTFDPESKVVTGADMQAKKLFEKIPVFFGKSTAGVNQSVPVGGPTELTMETWKQLPYQERVQREPELKRNLAAKK